MRSWGLVRACCLSLMGLAMVSCAEEREGITRVNANALSKEFFVGADLAGHQDDPEFYWRNYVVDGSVSQSLIGIGSWSGIDRIRWEITEDRLIAHKAYQVVKGADDKGMLESDPDGTVIAAYQITQHFDIKRAYNPSTGEEMNIVEENTTDKEWQERAFMRVDWSINLVDTPMWDDMFIGKVFGGIKLTSGSMAITDPNSPDAPHFEEGYFDITNRYYIEPAQSRLIPGLPTCFVVGIYTGSATYECDAQEAIVRSSYQRIDPGNDFERLEITKAPLDVVGNPAGIDVSGLLVGLAPPGEQGWDPAYGYTDELHHRFAHVHNIWQKSHQDAACLSNDDLDGDGTADACANGVTGYQGNHGSQCDTFAEKCTIPYRDRTAKTVTYWVNDQFPAELQDPVDEGGNPTARGAAEDVIYSWNQLLANAVARAREVECRRTGGEREACRAEMFDGDEMLSYGAWLLPKVKDPTTVLALCHNPVRAYDHEACGERGYKARLGDVRRNFFAYWPHASRAPWGGIGNWGADPLTGEIRGGAAMVMGRSVTQAAAWERDVIQVALGDLSIEDITNGVPATNYAHQLQNGLRPEALSRKEIARRMASIDAERAAQTIMPGELAGNTVAEKYQSFVDVLQTTTADPGMLTESMLEFDAVAEPLRGSLYEAHIVDQSWLVGAAALSPESGGSDAVLEMASPLRGLDPGGLRAMRERVQTALHMKGACFHDLEAPALGSVDLQGLAEYFRAKYPDGQYTPQQRGEAIYRDLWIETFKGIGVHEVGHSLGLLHNFASSWDSPNYSPQYWQLRSHEGQASASCEGEPREGDTWAAANDHCMGPRYLDPETDDEQGFGGEPRPGINYFAQTSVMEYPLERFGETMGLGSYDSHAMKALYGRVLETFDDENHGGFTRAEQNTFAPRLETQLTEQDRVVRKSAPFQGQEFAKPTHYTELSRLMRVFDPSRCREATPEEKAQAGWRIVHGKVCAPPPRDHAAWADFEDGLTNPESPGSEAPDWRTRAGTKTGELAVRWFYRYGTSGNSYYHTSHSDAGADPYEVTVNTIRRFDGNYAWQYFRRQNREYFYPGLPSAASNNTFERLRAYHWNVANRTAFYQGFGPANFEEIANSDDWHRPLLMAETEMFNAMARTILTPEPGDYGVDTKKSLGGTRAIFDVVTSGGSDFRIGAVDGRFIGEEYASDPDAGGSWNYTHWIKHAGFGVEKTYAAMALADGRPVLSTISRANYLDGRAVKINFRNDMPQAVDRLLAGILAEDWDTVGMYVDGTGEASPKMTPISATDAAPSRPANAKVLFPNVGYKQQLGALMFAQIFSRMSTDMSLTNKMRIWLDGQEGQIDIPEEQQVRFIDPQSGYTYIARKYGSEVIDGRTVDKGIASRMLQHANELILTSYQVEKGADGKPVLDAFGTPQVLVDGDGLPLLLPAGTTRIAELTSYVGLLDAQRQIGKAVGYGPLGGPGDD